MGEIKAVSRHKTIGPTKFETWTVIVSMRLKTVHDWRT